MSNLTAFQKQLMKFLLDNEGGKNYSFRKMGERLGGEKIIHHQTIANNIKALRNKGYIREDYDNECYIISEKSMSGTIDLPVYGSAQCGNNGTAILQERPIERIPYSTKALNLLADTEYFFVKAQGDSMGPVIEDGDLILIKHGESGLSDGKIALVVHQNKSKLKKIKKIDKRYYLESINKNYDKMQISPIEQFSVIGTAEKIIKETVKF